MFFICIYHIVVTLICLITGAQFYSSRKGQDAKKKPVIFYPITGLIIVTTIAQSVSLVLPLNGYLFFAFVFVLALCSLWRKEKVALILGPLLQNLKKISLPIVVLMVVVWFAILVLNAGPTRMDDTESYHIQMVKWIREYGTVAGIANLHERFGFNSSWFSSISFFLPLSNRINFYTALNGTISFWLGEYFIVRSYFSVQRNGFRISTLELGTLLIFVLSLLCWPMIRGNSTSANYDFITAFLLTVLFTETVATLRSGKKLSFEDEYFLWPVYLFTVRIINFPLLLLSFSAIFIIIKAGQWKKFWIYTAISVFLVVTFVGRNIMLSGYPFYPSTALNIFDVDWKVDEQTQTNLLTFIKYFNRVNTMFMAIDDTKKITFPSWTITWFRHLFSYDKIIVVPGLLGGFSGIFLLKKLSGAFEIRIFIVVLFLQLISWFFIAPDPRFVYGVFLCNTLLMFILFGKNKTFLITKKFFFSLCFICSFTILSYGSLKLVKNVNYRNFLLPASLPEPAVKEVTINNITLRIPEKIFNNWNPRCYATQLPCLYIVNPKLELRGVTIKDGFRIHK
jgi:hypothetical protein